MDLFSRTQLLSKLFSYEKRVSVADSRQEIIPFRFTQKNGDREIQAFQQELATAGFCPQTDDHILENKAFNYSVFAPCREKQYDQAIILLHGLNERNWNKYLTWAEFLVRETGKPVILFPIAFHMNRSPKLWSNPRDILPWVTLRRQEVADNDNLTFANVALSSRLSRHPLRFYASGRESVFNLCQLAQEITDGEHPLFAPHTHIDLLAYSIGALLSQVVLLANPNDLFRDTRLFMFCGGSIFSEMNGNARDIMDKEAYERLTHYYMTDFLQYGNLPQSFREDDFEKAFKAMIRPDHLQTERESFFAQACHRIRAISLKQDRVMPTAGIRKALGKAAHKILEELDFPFPYTHQVPFPLQGAKEKEQVDDAFRTVFGKAASFLL
ncbi:DUF6051 family protein [Parabacteroides sp. OttesenSCG-928-J18]|nr:DUF6051 family protein [Parabacteroides sp. OttesenSCG-928-J18]